MDKYLNTAIKAVITEFPKVGAILNEYGIGCVTCGVGTCLLKDVIDIHNVPKAVELEMMKKIEAVINNLDVEEDISSNEAAMQVPREISYSEPIQRLVDEHKLILELLDLVPVLCDKINADLEGSRELVALSADFIRQFADKFHHAKEEDILFAYAKGNSDIINVMLEDHKKGRYYAKSILLGLDMEDASFITYSLKHYRELLSEHIKKENEILYPWLEKGMSVEQLDELQREFDRADSSFESDFYSKWESFVKNI
ncbi:MAG: Hemerythrin cation binding domain protein [Clostridia bacterium]|jgi:hemerythrin-like domain-containing protein|nr:Hemerythrin cation binding domain protein [Clostridia bacterium]